MKFAHISDIHLNFVTLDKAHGARSRKTFLQGINDKISLGASFILLTGDITEAPFLTSELYWLSENLKRPLYYVLGNHDYWYTSFKNARNFAHIAQNLNKNGKICYLSTSNPIEMSLGVWLTGTDGWYDCRNFRQNEISDFLHGREALNDFDLIEDLINLPGCEEEKLQIIRDFADAEIFNLKIKLQYILSKSPKKIIIGTHIPPMILPNSKIKENHPGFYSCRRLMEILCEICENCKNTQFYLYCGHNHGGGNFEIDNLHISCKESRYDYPDSVLIEI